MDSEEKYRHPVMVAKKSSPYFSFVMQIAKGRSRHKIWLIHYGLAETWSMIEDE